MDKSIHHSETIFKMLQKINLPQKFSEVYISHIISIMIAIFGIGCHGKIDDTISSKTKPSAKAKHPIEDAYFHFSHLKRKQDYSHQAIEYPQKCLFRYTV